jgi:KDO2-lipid IV(A) lauroyltransferase
VARYILGNRFRAIADRFRVFRHLLWLVEAAFVVGVLWLIRLFPADMGSRLGRRAGSWLGPRTEKTEKFRGNLERAFPEKSPQEIDALERAVWGNAGAVMAELCRMPLICDPGSGRLEVDVKGQIAAFTRPDRPPAVFVAAHLANWEICAAGVAAMGVPMTAVFTPPTNPWMDKVLGRWRRALGCRLVPRSDSMRPLLRELKEGRSIGLICDQRVDSGVMLPFFGMDKATTLVPARLALRFNCELVPVRTIRTGDARFKVVFYPPVRPGAGLATEIEQGTDMMRQVNAMFEEWILERPQDWFCSKRRWSKEAVARVVEPAPLETPTRRSA